MTQTELILSHIRLFGSITPREALDLYGCMRLGARIYDLKHQGFDIRATRETGRNKRGERTSYARYYMGAEA